MDPIKGHIAKKIQVSEKPGIRRDSNPQPHEESSLPLGYK